MNEPLNLNTYLPKENDLLSYQIDREHNWKEIGRVNKEKDGEDTKNLEGKKIIFYQSLIIIFIDRNQSQEMWIDHD